jgi:hypothetical protein
MISSTQTIEKNRFPEDQNRHMTPPMSEQERRKSRAFMIAIAAALALATLAPVAVLAA